MCASDGEMQGSTACVWITTEACLHTPPDMLQGLYKLAWDSLQTIASDTQQQQEGGQTPILNFTSGGLDNLLVDSECFSVLLQGAVHVKHV